MYHCLQFLLGHEDVPREIKNNAYANCLGVKEVYHGICTSREYISVQAGLRGFMVKFHGSLLFSLFHKGGL